MKSELQFQASCINSFQEIGTTEEWERAKALFQMGEQSVLQAFREIEEDKAKASTTDEQIEQPAL